VTSLWDELFALLCCPKAPCKETVDSSPEIGAEVQEIVINRLDGKPQSNRRGEESVETCFCFVSGALSRTFDFPSPRTAGRYSEKSRVVDYLDKNMLISMFATAVSFLNLRIYALLIDFSAA